MLPGTSSDINQNEIPDECECLGDLNFDGVVDAADLAILLGQWGFPGPADFDVTGAVDAVRAGKGSGFPALAGAKQASAPPPMLLRETRNGSYQRLSSSGPKG